MTIASGTLAIYEYTESGSFDLIHNVAFPSFENEDIVVEVLDLLDVPTTLALTTDYTLKYVGLKGIDTEVTLLVPITNGFKLRVTFSTIVQQPTSFANLGRFAPVFVETVLDRFAMFILATKNLTTTIIDNTAADIAAILIELANHEARIDALELTVSSVAPIVSLEAVNFTADYTKIHIVNGATTVQLPAPVANGIIRLKIASSSVTILRNGVEDIDYVASNLVLTSSDSSIELVTDGTDWFIV
jgi:hypothetical protein